MTTRDFRCCSSAALWTDKTQSRQRMVCFLHSTDDERERVAATDAAAERIGLKPRPREMQRWGWVYDWTYGPNIDLRARELMIEWATSHGLRIRRDTSMYRRCLHWLSEGRCRYHCVVDGSHIQSEDPHYVALAGGSTSWMDHVTAWTRDGEPAALVSQPYGLDDRSRQALAVLAEHPAFEVEVDDNGGWYSRSTGFVVVRRA
ncbi:hypothetical protein PTQ19_12015 [Microbacterium esteraromaticum]|uniref:hypothetical protein n=1 Tax=Microbacterium esteraromaticum TaxID=57043 RepID=UPI0023682862|nr:hypothetical protein [Microbacterium esteraromaticum]WDH78236.1 hypothetical protein PTQ19_12015 [Microbacterium esteraromaticum]